MKNIMVIVLWIFHVLCLTVEYVWSVLFAVVDVIGSKINELTDASQKAYEKWRRIKTISKN